jgi:hypothetical protein
MIKPAILNVVRMNALSVPGGGFNSEKGPINDRRIEPWAA